MNFIELIKIVDIIGIIGVCLVLLAYLLLQLRYLSQDRLAYSMLNAIGSSFILVSLYYVWNLPSGVIEIAWLLISLLGVARGIIRKMS